MEPKSPGQFEQAPLPPEYQPSFPTPEVGRSNERGQERAPSETGAQERTQVHMPVAMPVPVPLPQPVQNPVTQGDQASDGTPALAADEDLIEKEWVDKAKKIIEATKDDPSRREREVSKLQADYLMKRYGKQLGKTE